MKIAEFIIKRNSSQGPNCTFLESVCAHVLRGRYLQIHLEAKVVYESKVRIFFLAVKYADQGDLQPVVFILHPDTPKLVIVSELVLNAQKDWMNHHGSEFYQTQIPWCHRFKAFGDINFVTQIFLELKNVSIKRVDFFLHKKELFCVWYQVWCVWLSKPRIPFSPVSKAQNFKEKKKKKMKDLNQPNTSKGWAVKQTNE